MIQRTKKALMITIVLLLSVMHTAFAQEKKVAHTSQELYNEIARADSLMFTAFNKQDLTTFQAMFTEDLEWFQDNGGLLSYKTVFENFSNNFTSSTNFFIFC